ncbi:MAG: excinuclease ABC subunit UvrA [Verrucomicrobiota bacterium]
MLKKSAPKFIRLRGVRHNNLKNFDLDLPLGKLIVVTGLSGSGKSSLAFDTLFAEGQRRYIETFSPYARQFLDRMDKPQVDSIEGIPPAIAIEQRNSVKSTRSTVGTMTEICDYAKLLWPHLAQLHCKNCGQLVRKDSPQIIWENMVGTRSTASQISPASARPNDKVRDEVELVPTAISEILVTFDIPLSDKISLEESLALISKQGYQRLLVGNEILRIEESISALTKLKPTALTIVQDRIKVTDSNRKRFVEACEQAYHFGKGKLAIREIDATTPRFFSNRFHCAHCDIEYREPSPALFSFNHPVGACPTCRGFGRTITIDYDLAIPERTKTLAEGAVKPWQTETGVESQRDMMKFCKLRKVPTNVPFKDLPRKFQDWVIEGDPGYGKDSAHEWPRAWYGVKGYFRWLESKAYKMHVRVLLSRYRKYQTCADCGGTRFQLETLGFKISWKTPVAASRERPADFPKLAALSRDAATQINIAQFYHLSIQEALRFVETNHALRKNLKSNDPLTLALNEVRSRLNFLDEVGLGYLTLDRATRTLSGGETERVNLTTCLGSGLVNTLFVLDEPSVGLHPRDTERLIKILQRLRDAGNTVVVVEHESSVMRAADQIVDLGPGHGESGGELVFQGTFREILKSKTSLTGKYLSGKRKIEIPKRRAVERASRILLAENGDATHGNCQQDAGSTLLIRGANVHNLKNLSVEIPLGRFVCISGVSGSGKTTLIRDVLLPGLERNFQKQETGDRIQNSEDDEEVSELSNPISTIQISGWENLGGVLLVDQSALGKTPRSNPAVYIGAFEDIRELFAQTDLARQRGLNASAFSFNSAQGQCEKCRGAGFEKIEMQFLSDVFIRCPECNGRRYRPHILEIKLSLKPRVKSPRLFGRATLEPSTFSRSIAELLEATVDEAILFLRTFAESKAAQRAAKSLELLQEVGLGYLRIGQPINTLSGGESQRLKLVSHLARAKTGKLFNEQEKPTLFLFDEPTTGLHFDDVRVLLKVFHRLVNDGHSVVVIEHNVDVIRAADWVIDLGPEAGADGGRIVVEGDPTTVAACKESFTGQALAQL